MALRVRHECIILLRSIAQQQRQQQYHTTTIATVDRINQCAVALQFALRFIYLKRRRRPERTFNISTLRNAASCLSTRQRFWTILPVFGSLLGRFQTFQRFRTTHHYHTTTHSRGSIKTSARYTVLQLNSRKFGCRNGPRVFVAARRDCAVQQPAAVIAFMLVERLGERERELSQQHSLLLSFSRESVLVVRLPCASQAAAGCQSTLCEFQRRHRGRGHRRVRTCILPR